MLADTLGISKIQKYQSIYFFLGRPTYCDTGLPLIDTSELTINVLYYEIPISSQ